MFGEYLSPDLLGNAPIHLLLWYFWGMPLSGSIWECPSPALLGVFKRPGSNMSRIRELVLCARSGSNMSRVRELVKCERSWLNMFRVRKLVRCTRPGSNMLRTRGLVLCMCEFGIEHDFEKLLRFLGLHPRGTRGV
ncbi:hypothetical protein ACFE04_021812 [Oxalis oulophora]